MGASLSTEKGMTADERDERFRAKAQIRAIVDKAIYRILGAPMFLAFYVTVLLGNIPWSTTTTMTALPLFLLAGTFMVMNFSTAFFSVKEIGERMARERVRRARNNGVETEELSSFLRFTWHNLIELFGPFVLGFMLLFVTYACGGQCPCPCP